MSILKILISQTKVGNFANKVVIKKNITSCQVAMDDLHKLNILFYILNKVFNKNYQLVFAPWKKKDLTLALIFGTSVNQFKSNLQRKSLLYSNPGIGEELNAKKDWKNCNQHVEKLTEGT